MNINRRHFITTAVVGVGSTTGCMSRLTGGDNNKQPLTTDGTNNPWSRDVIIVKVTNTTDSPRNFNEMARQAINHWNKNMSELDFSGQFKLQTSDKQSNIEIKIVESVDSCGQENNPDAVGCAPHYSESGSATDTTTTVKIESGYKRDATKKIIKHEIGHTLGLKHNDADEWEVMEAEATTPEVTQPPATEKENPWEKDTIKVYYSDNGTGELDSQITVDQLDSAISYYNTEADILPDDVELKTTTNKKEAEIIIGFSNSIDGASVGDWSGYDPDKDGNLESYTNAKVIINTKTNREKYGWHAGFWIGQTFGVSSPDGLPDPFDDPQNEDRIDWS